ncbi:MD2L1-like protein [Mya arenaria]|uniref:MD2L1-like protein n=1 Tax=Mya arenaria TaxID=6604 RepID=A0ABY7DG52_MYAAR|nr:MD2L1-like protein [Mya arenaria]
MAATASKNAITLKGSTEIVAEFFDYGINSILYQRGIYPPEMFTREQKYGLTLLMNTDESIKDYLSKVISQIKEWLMNKTVSKLVVVIKSLSANEVLERWQFDVEKPVEKSEKEIHEGIRAVIRQITASVTFLPLIEEPCSFDLLVYTDKDLDVPESWGESGPQFVADSEEVRLRSFTTTIHKVDTMVAYKKV